MVKRLRVGDKVIEATTIKGLADILGKSKDAVARYEELGYFPQALLTLGGNRLKPIVQKFPPNRPPSAELRVQITQIFNDERNKLCQNQK